MVDLIAKGSSRSPAIKELFGSYALFDYIYIITRNCVFVNSFALFSKFIFATAFLIKNSEKKDIDLDIEIDIE